MDKRISKESRSLFTKAQYAIPGGVNSPVRAFKSVGGIPPFIRRGSGSKVWDIDDNEFIDYIGSWGPLIIGHSHPKVALALIDAVENGTSFGMPCKLEVDLAEEVKARVPSIDKIRFVNSGTEASMSAIRLARAFTGRSKIIKFKGCYLGLADSLLVSAGSGAATFGLPDSPGVTTGAAVDTLVARFNDLSSVHDLFSLTVNRSGQPDSGIAAIIVEPVAGNMGVIPPEKGFLEGLRVLCDKQNCLLILDEVMTGFRVAHGGAQQLYGVKPDLTMFGKVIGGGLPVGAFGGRDDIMSMLAPEGNVYQAGTLSGNPLAMTGGLATLGELNKNTYIQLEGTAATLQNGLEYLFRKYSQQAIVQRVGSMLTVFFTSKPVRNFDDAKKADHKKFAIFFNVMLDQGILLPPSGYEAWFISTAHSKKDIERTLKAVAVALAACE